MPTYERLGTDDHEDLQDRRDPIDTADNRIVMHAFEVRAHHWQTSSRPHGSSEVLAKTARFINREYQPEPRQEPWWFPPNERLESPSLLEWVKF
jgi:hypothetical protein